MVEYNPDYPDACVADFDLFYSSESSDIPWQTNTNCSVCGRIAQRLNLGISKEVAEYDPYSNKYHYFLVCSPQCEKARKNKR